MLEQFRQKIPLSCLLYGLLERCFAAERLDRIFLENAKEQYVRELLFSTVCDLMMGVVLKVHPSVNAAHQKRPESLGVTVSALYEKLEGVELAVSSALLRETSADLSAVLGALGFEPEAWLPGYPVRVLDGNCLAASEKRLAVHHDVCGAALPGKSPVVFDPERRLMRDVFPCEDGHAQETPPAGRAGPGHRDRGTVDRRPQLLHAGNARPAAPAGSPRLGAPAPQPALRRGGLSVHAGQGPGRRVLEKSAVVDGRRYRLARVELESPTRDGDTVVDLLTDLPRDIPATTIADLYRRRWTLDIYQPYNLRKSSLAFSRWGRASGLGGRWPASPATVRVRPDRLGSATARAIAR